MMAYFESMPLTFYSKLDTAVKSMLGGVVSINETWIPDFPRFKTFFLDNYEIGESVVVQFIAPLSSPPFLSKNRVKITRTSTGFSASVEENVAVWRDLYNYRREISEEYSASNYERLHIPVYAENRDRITTETTIKTPPNLYPRLSPNGFESVPASTLIPACFNPARGIVDASAPIYGEDKAFTVFVGMSQHGFKWYDGEFDGIGNWIVKPKVERLPRVYHGISHLFCRDYDFSVLPATLYGANPPNNPVNSSIISLKWLFHEWTQEPITNWEVSPLDPYDLELYYTGLIDEYHDGYWACYGSNHDISYKQVLKVGVDRYHCFYYSEFGGSCDLPERNYTVEKACHIELYTNFHFVDIRNFTLGKLIEGYVKPVKTGGISSAFPHSIAIDLLSGANIMASSGLSSSCRLPFSINTGVNVKRS